MPQFNHNKKEEINPGLLAQGIESELEKIAQNPETEKKVEIELHPEKPEEVTEFEQIKPEQEQIKIIPSSSILSNEEMDELEKLEKERDERILAERETARMEELKRKQTESKKIESPLENPELAQMAKKIEPMKRAVEAFIKNYSAFNAITEGKIDPSGLTEEAAKEVLEKLPKDQMEKLISYVSSEIAPFYLSTLPPHEKQLWIEGLRKFTSGAVKIVIDEVLNRSYSH